jgi:hypothetical protein
VTVAKGMMNFQKQLMALLGLVMLKTELLDGKSLY